MPTSPKGFSNSRFLRQIKQTIVQFAMFHPGDRVLVALSGGPDSMAMLYSLRQMTPELPLRLGVAHLNHQLRGAASDRDAAFSAETADRLGLPFYTHAEDVDAYRNARRLSPEEAARERRYAFLTRTAGARGYGRIAVGHTADDNAEQVLMHIFRGTGAKGLGGIPPVRGPIVRPLIRTRRKEVLAFLAANGLDWMDDASNRDERLLRNRVRRRVIPFLEQTVHPAVSDSLNRLADIMRDEDAWREAHIETLFERCAEVRNGRNVHLDTVRLAEIHPGAQRRIIRKAVEAAAGSLRKLTYAHVDAVLKLIHEGPPEGHVDLPDGLHVDRCYNAIALFPGGSPEPSRTRPGEFAYEVPRPGALEIPEIGMILTLSVMDRAAVPETRLAGQQVAFFDMEKVRFPVAVRNVRPGDRFQPLGMTGTQKLSDFFINNKIPQRERRRCPVLLSRDTIVWVAGHRIAETVKIDASTQRVLRGELFLA